MTRLFVAVGDFVARVTDGRAEAVLEQPGAQCIAVDPRNAERALAGCRGGGVFETEDGGTTWHDAGLPATEVFWVAYSPADGAAYAGCEPSALWARRDGSWEGSPPSASSLRRRPEASRPVHGHRTFAGSRRARTMRACSSPASSSAV